MEPHANILNPRDCRHERTEVRRKLTSDGRVQHRNQCLDCGAAIGSAVKQTGAVGDWDQSLEDAGKNLESEWFDRNRQTREQERQREREYYHNDYLNSAEWRQKRDLVLKRDGYVCQACLTRRAILVHHKSYKSARELGLGNEPCFDLVALCGACHEALHPEKQLAGSSA